MIDNPTISVLMSVFNETPEQITASMDSVLNQSFSDFEIIVVIDNPNRPEYRDLLSNYQQRDNRVKWFVNDKNIGLAMCMNKAFALSKGAFIARMDADDVCHSERFAKEIEALKKGYDFVFTNYDLIDEDGCFISRDKAISVSINESLQVQIANRSIIHHPTVMFTREIFVKAGQYRDFPCSQDLDLWLRMIDSRCTFFFIDEVLLDYRIRQTSVSGKRRFKQHLTIDYIRNCFLVKLRTGNDPYDYKSYLSFIEKKYSEKRQKHYDKMSLLLSSAKTKRKQGKKAMSIIERMIVFLFSTTHRNTYIFNRKIAQAITRQYGK